MAGVVFLGVADWRHENWAPGFYPDDMPMEWRLTYYNTQFDCVWLGYSAWSAERLEALHEWVADTRGDFRFVLESFGDISLVGDARLAAIAPRLARVTEKSDPDLIWFDASANLRTLMERIDVRVKQAPSTYLISLDAHLATIERVKLLVEMLGVGPRRRVG